MHDKQHLDAKVLDVNKKFTFIWGINMNQEKIDRRIKYTKHALQEALIELLEHHSIAKISVAMLCKEADVNRSTFYAHYESVPQMLEQIQNDTMENLQNYISSHSAPYDEFDLEQTMLQILTYVSQNHRLFKALLGKNGNWDIKSGMIKLLNTDLMDIISPELLQDHALFSYVIEFSVNGSTSVIVRWIETGMKESPSHMAKTITYLLMKNVATNVGNTIV